MSGFSRDKQNYSLCTAFICEKQDRLLPIPKILGVLCKLNKNNENQIKKEKNMALNESDAVTILCNMLGNNLDQTLMSLKVKTLLLVKYKILERSLSRRDSI